MYIVKIMLKKKKVFPRQATHSMITIESSGMYCHIYRQIWFAALNDSHINDFNCFNKIALIWKEFN